MAADCSFFQSSMVFTTDCALYCTADGAADHSFFLSSTAFTTVCAPYCTTDGSGLLIPPLVNGFPDGSRAVLRSGWRRIARGFSRQRLSRRFVRHIDQRMAADCSFVLRSMAFTTVCAPYCSADGAGLLILTLVNSFHDGLHAVLLSGWRRIAHSFSRQWLSRRFARRIAQQMAADCSFFRSSSAFTTVFAPYFSADGGGLLILPLVNGFHDGFHAVLLSGWQRIAHSSSCQWFSQRIAHRIAQRMARRIAHSFSRQRLSRRFARRIAQWMAADCSYHRSSTAFPTVRVPYCPADGGGLVILSPVNGFHDGLRAVLLSGWQRIAHSSARQRLFRRFARHISQRTAAHCSFFHWSTAFTTVRAPYCLADCSGLRIPPFANGFHAGFRAVLLCGWQRIAHSSAHQQLSRWFARRIAQRMVSDCPHLRLSMAFTTDCAPYCSADGSGLLNLPLANSFHDGLHAVLLCGWYRIVPTSARQRLSR